MKNNIRIGQGLENGKVKNGILFPLKSIQSFFAARVNNIISITDTVVVSKYGKYIPRLIFATSIAVSTQLRRMEYQSTVKEIETQLDSQLLDIIYPIQSRLKSYEQILYGVHGLFDASKSITRDEFKSYLNSLSLEQNFPEIPGVSVSFYIHGKDIKKHINKIKSEGFPKYGNSFRNDQTEYAPVTYIEPFRGPNLKVFGFDNFSDETRKELLKSAQMEYKPMITGPIALKQENTTSDKNFLMTFPVYSKSHSHTNPQDRVDNIVGWGSLVFCMDELVKKIYNNKLIEHGVEIYDGSIEDQKKLLYSSVDEHVVQSKFKVKRVKTIPVLNREWTFVIHSSDLHEKMAHHQGYLDNILYSGFFVTFLLTLLSHGFIRMRLESLDLLKKQEKSIQDLEQVTQKMKHLAIHDPLTKLPNRVGFLEQLSSLISLANRHDSKIAFMFVDLDKFKYVNDNYGHHIGDQLLVHVTERIKHTLRGEDVIGRQGGDEFFVAIGDFKDIEVASKVARKIIEALKNPFIIENHEIHIGSSIGISIYPDDTKDVSILQQYADLAMYSVKGSGRNGYHFYTDSMQKDAEEYNKISNALRHAIEKQEFSMVYQPIIDAKTGKMASMESLIRWNSPELGVVSPAKFIPIAENDLFNIEAIGNWTLEAVCDQINIWKNSGHIVPRVTVNLSARQFLKETFQEDLLQIITQRNISPHEIGLEITEGSLFNDIYSAVTTVNNLSNLGFTILIDDFGTGYSNLHYISKFSAGVIKIDKSFISTMEQEENSQIIKLIITLAHSLGMKVVAEGVEEIGQYEYLQQLQCDFIQGYYCGKPGKPEDVIEKLNKNEK